MYRQRLHYFNYMTEDEKVIEKFEDFMIKNLTPFFSEAYNVGLKINVSDALARSTIKEGNEYNKVFKSLANTIERESSNQSVAKRRHQLYIFKVILSESTSFQKMKNLIVKYLAELVQESFTWNKVYYGNYLERTFTTK